MNENKSLNALVNMVDVAGDICKHYRKAEAEKGRPFPETFIDPMTSKETDNAVMIPVRLLNALVKAANS
jgi:hypothetical protein